MKINRINKILIPSFVGLTLLVSTSCESDVNDLNTNPNSFPSVDPTLQIGTADLATVLSASSDISRLSSIYSNHMAGAGAQWAAIESYTLTAGDFDNVWNNAYQQGINQARNVKTQALISGDNVLVGQALVNEAIQLGELAAFFNDVPDTDAIVSENPVYDSQVDVLNSVQAKLDSAITYLNGSSVFSPNIISSPASSSEIIQSLKARYYLIQKDYTNALIAAQSGISSSANDAKSVHKTTNGTQNIWYQFDLQRGGNIVGTGSYLYDLLDPNNTAVQRNLNTPGDTFRFNYYYNNNGDFNTTSPDLDNDGTEDTFSISNGSGVFAINAPFPIISWYETKLIEAEAAYRVGDEATALATLNEVRADLTTSYPRFFEPMTPVNKDYTIKIIQQPKNGNVVINKNGNLDASDDYFVFTSDGTSFTGTDVFEYEVCDNSVNPTCTTSTITFETGFPASIASGDDLLKDILEEKYITLFCQTQVAHDLARTNNFIGVPAKTGADLPVRFLYPQAEINSNSNIPTTRPGIFVPTTINQ